MKHAKNTPTFTFLSLLLLTWLSVETKKPYSKRQLAIWQIECGLGVINDPDCPIDGAWSPWSPWSPCQGPCDDIGKQKRTRECINPPPSLNGLPCGGSEQETKACFLTNCTAADFADLVRGDIVRLDAYIQLQTVPSLMERCLQMECPFEAIEVALSTDNTWKINSEELWNSLQCVKHNVGCPVKGEWGSWGSWTACGAQCGKGLRWRLRRCDMPQPSAAHLICTGCPLQSEECEGDHCAIDDPSKEPIGAWGDWGEWSACSESCGTGVRQRRRPCNKRHISTELGTWGTHCRGQYDQLEICEVKPCTLNGGWSGWSSWGPCSRSCGAGKRSRIRSCTRPIPAGKGVGCVGPRSEVGSCHIIPCNVYSHTVAVLNGESFLHYNFPNKRSVLFHFYIRFLPLSPHGTLVRRGTAHNPHVRLSLQKWHVCLDASGSSGLCGLPRLCTVTRIEPAVWHTVLITVTGVVAMLRLDDQPVATRSTFACDPELPDDTMNIIVGEKLHGEIQELVLNFIPLNIMMDRNLRPWKTDFHPSPLSTVIYEKANLEEAYLTLDYDYYLRLPCFSEKDWLLELTLRPKGESGTILFLQDKQNHSWLHIILQNNRLKMKLANRSHRSESSSIECPAGQWFDIVLSKKKHANTIEMTINSDEQLHVTLVEETLRKRRGPASSIINRWHQFPTNKLMDRITRQQWHNPASLSICADEFFIGGVPSDIKQHTHEEFTAFSGILASLSINTVLQDLHSFSMERCKDETLQVSSKTASVSGSYHETAWGESNLLNLTCLHARIARSPNNAHWLFLDSAVSVTFKFKAMRSLDDGRVLRLVATAENDLRGFYTCRAHSYRKTRNIVTYGVIGKVQYQLSGPDTTTVIAVITTLMLVVLTLGWLFIEGLNDLRNGYGFFRDPHFTPEEEAEAVCNYIDQNIHLYSSKSVANLAKVRARLKAQKLSSRLSFGAQEPQGMLQESKSDLDIWNETDLESLPALPENANTSCNSTQNMMVCEPCYISSPRHGSNIVSPRTKFTSSSMLDATPPKLLCSRLLFSRRIYTSRENLISRTKISPRRLGARYRSERSKLLPAKDLIAINTPSPIYNKNPTPPQRVLQKFKELKSHDSAESS